MSATCGHHVGEAHPFQRASQTLVSLPPGLDSCPLSPCSHLQDGTDSVVSGREVFSQKPGLTGCCPETGGSCLRSMSCLCLPANLPPRRPLLTTALGRGRPVPPTPVPGFLSRGLATHLKRLQRKLVKMGGQQGHRAVPTQQATPPGPHWVPAPSSDKNGTG